MHPNKNRFPLVCFWSGQCVFVFETKYHLNGGVIIAILDYEKGTSYHITSKIKNTHYI